MHSWVNGRLLEDPEAPAIGVTDHGLTVGDGVFEAIKVVDGEPFALTRHLDRLGRSAAALGLPSPDIAVMRSAITEVLAAEHAAAGAVADHLHRGSRAPGVGTRGRHSDVGRRRGTDAAGAQDHSGPTGAVGRATSAERWRG